MRPMQVLAMERKRLLLKKCASSKGLSLPSSGCAEELRDENFQLEVERSDENDMTRNPNPVELVQFALAKRLSLSVEKPWSSEYPVEISEDEFPLLQDERSDEDDITRKSDPAGGLRSTNAKRRWKSVLLPIKAIVRMSSSQEPASKIKKKTSNPILAGSSDNEDGLQIPSDRPMPEADRLKSVRRELDNRNEKNKLDTSVNKSDDEVSDEERAVFGMDRFKRREKHTSCKPGHLQSRNNGTLSRNSCSERNLVVPTEIRHASASAPELGYAHVDDESSDLEEERSNYDEFTPKSNWVRLVESPSAKKRLSSSVEKQLSSEYAVELNDGCLRVEEERPNENCKTRKSDDPLGLSSTNAKQRWKSIFLPVKAIVRMTSSQEAASKSMDKTICEVSAESKVSNPVSAGSRRDNEDGLRIPDRPIMSEADRLNFVRRELDNWNEKKKLDTSVNTSADEFSDEGSTVFGMERFKRREKHRISKPSHFQSRKNGALIRKSCSERNLVVPTETRHTSASAFELGYTHDDEESSDPDKKRSNDDGFTRKSTQIELVESPSARKRLSSSLENQLSSEYAVELNDEFLRAKEERSNEHGKARKADTPLELSSTNARRRWKSVFLPMNAIARMSSSSQETSTKSRERTNGEVLAETEASNPVLVAGFKDNEDGSGISDRPIISEADRLKFVQRELGNWNEKKKLDSSVNESADEFSDEDSAVFGMERFKRQEKHIPSKSSHFQSRNNEKEVRPLLTEIFLEENTQHAFASELAALGYVQDDDGGDSLDPSERSVMLKATVARLRREYKELTGKDKVFRVDKAEEVSGRTNAEATLTLAKPSEAGYEDELVCSDYDSNEDRLQMDEDIWSVVELVGAKTKNEQSQSTTTTTTTTTTTRAKHTKKSDIDSSRRKRFKSRTMRKKEEKHPSRANSRARKEKSLHPNGDGSTPPANESEGSENARTPGKVVCNVPRTPTVVVANASMISRSEVHHMLLEMERQWQFKLEALEKQLGDRLEKKASRLSD